MLSRLTAMRLIFPFQFCIESTDNTEISSGAMAALNTSRCETIWVLFTLCFNKISFNQIRFCKARYNSAKSLELWAPKDTVIYWRSWEWPDNMICGVHLNPRTKKNRSDEHTQYLIVLLQSVQVIESGFKSQEVWLWYVVGSPFPYLLSLALK